MLICALSKQFDALKRLNQCHPCLDVTLFLTQKTTDVIFLVFLGKSEICLSLLFGIYCIMANEQYKKKKCHCQASY